MADNSNLSPLITGEPITPIKLPEPTVKQFLDLKLGPVPKPQPAPKPAQNSPESFDEFPVVSEEEAAQEGVDVNQFSQFQEPDGIDLATPEELANDPNFDVQTFVMNNPEALSDPFKRETLLEAERISRIRGLNLRKVAVDAVKASPGIVVDFLKGARDTTDRLIQAAVQPAISMGLGSFENDPQTQKFLAQEIARQQKKAVAELAAGSETASFGFANLARTGLRKVGERIARLTDKVGLTEGASLQNAPLADIERDLLDDIAFAQQQQAIVSGQGAAAELAGLDAASLSKQGIELDPAAIESISFTDPLTLVATGGAFQLVGKLGKVVATTRTVKQATELARKFGTTVVQGGRAGAGAVTKAAGATISATGRGVERLGQASRGPLSAVGGVAGVVKGAELGGAAGALAGAAAGAAGGRTLARGISALGRFGQRTGAAVGGLGRQITGEAAPNRLFQTISAIAKAPPVAGAAAGAAIGAAAGVPFALAAESDQEAAQLLGAGIGLGAAAGAGVGGVRSLVGLRERVVGNRLLDPAQTEPGPLRESPAYGSDPALDATHQTQFNTLDPASQSLVNEFRELFRNEGEIYVQSPEEYTNRILQITEAEKGAPLTPEEIAAAREFASTHAVFSSEFPTAVGPKKVVFLNDGVVGLRHDAGHLFQSLLPEAEQSRLRQEVSSRYTPEELQGFKDTYESALNQNLPEGAQRKFLTPDELVDEIIAENFSALFSNLDVSTLGTPRPLMDRLIQAAASFAERAGIDLTGGRTTPASTLGARPSFGVTRMLENLVRQRETARRPAAGEAPRVSSEEPAGPRNKRVTTTEQTGTAAPAPETANIALARAFAEEAKDPNLTRVVDDIAAAFERKRGEVTPLEFEVLGAKESEPGRVSTREQRLEERLRADIAEAAGTAPEDVRDLFQAVQVPVRFETVGKGANRKLQLLGMSLDKVMANVGILAREATKRKIESLIPYDVQSGAFTPDAWRRFQKDLVAYTENQQHGYRGDGRQLVRPDESLGASIPPEDPNFVPRVLPEEVGNFINLIQGIAPPRTARVTGPGVPGNVKARTIAELNLRPVETPAKILPRDIEKQTFPTGETVGETNPLRNEFSRKGFDVRSLHEVTERFRVDRIKSVKPRSELQFRAPFTDVVRAGFLPKTAERAPRTGREFDQFFTDVSAGKFGFSDIPFEPISDLSRHSDFTASKERHSGNFDDHIRKSIPSFYETQIRKGDAISRVYSDTGADVLDIGGSEGSFGKAITETSGGKVRTTTLDPNKQMQSVFEANPVEGANFVSEAFLNGFEDQGRSVPAYQPDKAYDVVNETMTFQFIDPDRVSQIKEVKRMLKPDGVALIEEKVRNPDWAENEAVKDRDYKSRYFSSDDLQKKDQRVGFQQSRDESKAVGMVDNMATQEQLESVLKSNFKHVVQYWDSGNFKGYAASDNLAAVNRLVQEMGDMKTQFSTVETPVEVRFLPSAELENLSIKYRADKKRNIPKVSAKTFDESLAREIADFHDRAPKDVLDSETLASYEAFIRETKEQYEVLRDAGFEIEPWEGKGEPYPDSKSMREDVQQNRHLYYLKSEGHLGDNAGVGSGYPLLRDSGVRINGKQVPYNDLFRAVHDVFGHAQMDNSFSMNGEFRAWADHSQMYSPEAQSALALETLSYNAWFNAGEHTRGPGGKILKKGDEGYVPLSERPYAPRKTYVFPEDFLARARGEKIAKSKFLPAEPSEAVAEVAKLGAAEFKRVMDAQEGGLTGAAVRIGKKFNSPEQIELLRALEQQAADDMRSALKEGRIDDAMILASKPQFFREARESATNTGSIGEARARGEVQFLPKKLPKNETPRTDSGRKLVEEGFRVSRETGSGIYDVRILDGDEQVGLILAHNTDPVTVKVDNVFVGPEHRGKGFAETLYRELATDLQDAGITRLTGNVISDIPLNIRKKVFGEFEEVVHPVEGSQTGSEATARLRESREARERGEKASIEFVNPISRIDPQARFLPKKASKKIPLVAKAFIEPDGTFTKVTRATHDDYLIENAEALNKKYGTKIPKEQGGEDVRVNALSKGFVRVTYEPNQGQLTYEANVKTFRKPQRDKILEHVLDNLDDIDNIRVALVDDKGNVVKSADRRFFLMEDDAQKLDSIPFVTDEGRPDSSRLTPFFLPKDAFKDKGFSAEVEKIAKGEKEGETFNVDGTIFNPGDRKLDVVTVASTDIPARDLSPETIKQALEEYSPLLENDNVRPGLFRISRKTKDGAQLVSVDVNVLVPQEFRDNTLKFAQDNNQESFFDLVKSEVVDSGGDGNTVLKSPDQILEAVDKLVRGEEVDLGQAEQPLSKFLPRAKVQQSVLEFTDEPPPLKRTLNKKERGELNRRELREAFPEAVVPRSPEDSVGYGITESPLFKKHKADKDRVNAFAEKLVEKYNQHKDAPEAKLGLKWYDDFTPLLKARYAEDAPVFAELLAATSPNNTPRVNFQFAEAAYRRWKSGDFDAIISKFQEGLKKLADGSLAKEYAKKVPKAKQPAKPSDSTYMGWWIDEHDLIPRQEARTLKDGTVVEPLFGLHSKAVLKVITRQWLQENKGPKTNNFVKNLIGESEEATIDLWAARTMREAGYKDFQDRWRILPENSVPLADADFFFSQKVFKEAARRLGLKAHQLQGALWFIEKKLWADRGWVELNLGDYRSELRRIQEIESEAQKTEPQIELF